MIKLKGLFKSCADCIALYSVKRKSKSKNNKKVKLTNDIKDKIIADCYEPKTTMSNLISMIILSFDCDDNYGEYDEETGPSFASSNCRYH